MNKNRNAIEKLVLRYNPYGRYVNTNFSFSKEFISSYLSEIGEIKIEINYLENKSKVILSYITESDGMGGFYTEDRYYFIDKTELSFIIEFIKKTIKSNEKL